MKKLLSVFVICSFILVGCGGSSKDDKKDDGSKKIVVATNSGYAPYEMVDKDGKLYGFDIELMELLAKETGYELEWKDMDFDGIIDSVKNGQVDAGMAGISADPKRENGVKFSDNYYGGEDSENYFVFKKDSKFTSLKDLKGKTVGVQRGTIQETAVDAIAEENDFKIERLAQYTDLFQMMENGQIDAIMLEKAVTEQQMKEKTDWDSFIYEGVAINGTSIVFKEGSPMIEEFNKAIQKVKDNGELDKLVEKWFTVEE